MNKLAALLPLLSFLLFSFASQKPELPRLSGSDELQAYTGNDLGVSYLPKSTNFKVWAPQAGTVKLRLYAKGEGGAEIKTFELSKGPSGTWEKTVSGDLKNKYYTFQTYINGKWSLECPDLYARAVGINGHRGMIIDLKATNPTGWENEKKPLQSGFTDIILYELHIRDLSASPGSGIHHTGKFLGLAETGTHTAAGQLTGLAHIKELGVTHVHLLPSFDFNSVDEKNSKGAYNWGYDPLNYNVPEGSYATNAYDGNTRVREFKQLVSTLHKNGLRVILDVVYNHTSNIEASNFTQFAPGYFYRHNADSSYSNGTGCGNETASEKTMMRKFMIESVCYWATEYHLDGFRFDLMGIHDIFTMNAISAALHKIDPAIFIYGEGWDAGQTPLPAADRALKKNVTQLVKIAAFSDDMRDGIRGVNTSSQGFVSGRRGTAESIKFGIVASTLHRQVNYRKVNYSKAAWANEPYQAINYASCHDDNTLYDRLKIANPGATEAALIRMDKLAAAIVLTSQGIPFIMAGEEFIRTKRGIANSYNSPDSINEIDWNRKSTYHTVYTYYKSLIVLRKNHPAFRMPAAEMIRKHLQFLPAQDSLTISYELKAHANRDRWKTILVVLNGNADSRIVSLPKGKWMLIANEDEIIEQGIKQVENSLVVSATAAYILVQN